ncbi:unnamed protein product [Rotaria magnacalcarata]|uniref:VWFA domain-containing protein n=1 Tax=Rotaria magnacalcarata TaxID=392030 RepID=A0A814T7V4_9BILA|nr:unnamed protein product [Rotaria magnacalcarata]CAF1672392.1 unnamed protein product [Rotaria magnacalcarata]CAF2046840.1 unnamed protein product [Rotaria magnacalcarata]CAF3804727.1 unnamed protein product [Rotaria magnacalcarata]CAF3823749.1 unnamed protein product [Rotaria magnacalcarata]
MASYFKTPFQIGGESHFIEVKVPKVDASAGNNIICCVDVSGSMDGAPIRNVCQVLRDIYQRTQREYGLFTYNTTVNTSQTIKSVEKNDLTASGGTSFSSIFNAIQTHLMKNQKSVTFIFMTDGQDGDSQEVFKQAIQRMKLTISALPRSVTVTFHVIGFGDVNSNFLEQVRKFGTREGLFRYSTKSVDLQNNFNDMFDYAMSSREFAIVLNGQTFSSSSNEDTVGFLINGMKIDTSSLTEITLKSSDSETKLTLEQMANVRPIHVVRALNLVSPDNEESVQAIRSFLGSIVWLPGTELMEKLELEQIKKEIDDRMMEYTNLFTQMKMGQVPEQVQLKLNALRHDATFANVQRRKKLDLRISKNVDYFRKTDISGILDGYRQSIDQDGWNRIKEQKSDWVCTYSNDDIYEMMRKTSDNIMCLGILIERNEEAITSPTKGLKLISVSNTLISYDSFITAMNFARNAHQQKNLNTEGGATYGQFSGINDTFCAVGQLHEKINAVIPLYINYEHMKRIRILEGIWLGYMFTLDSYGYEKQQEIGLLKLLYDIIMLRTGTTKNQQIISEFEKVCHFIITESTGFKTAYGENTYENYLQSIHGRQSSTYDLSIPLIIAYLKKHLKPALLPIYYGHLHSRLHQKLPGDRMTIIKRLLYGDENQIIKTVASNKDKELIDISQADPDYVEKSFIDYFHDETSQPIELIPETKTGEDRKLIQQEVDVEYLKSFLQSIDPQLSLAVPLEIKNLLKYCQLDENYLESNLDYDDLRKELLLILFYEKEVPERATKSTIMTLIDDSIQGNRDHSVTFDITPEGIRVVTYKLLTAKTLEGFGGLLRKYCPKRFGPIFKEILQKLATTPESDLSNTSGEAFLNREKLLVLLTNEIGYSQVYTGELGEYTWQPSLFIDVTLLEKVLGTEKFREIQRKIASKTHYHGYRLSDKPNRHGHCNSNPYYGRR